MENTSKHIKAPQEEIKNIKKILKKYKPKFK